MDEPSTQEDATASSKSSLTDHSLLRRYRSGEQDAATELYVRYASRLIGLARTQSSPALAPRIDPDDVVQSVFRTFFRRVADGCYDVPPGEELWQLLLVLALNKIRSLASFHRARKRDVGATVSVGQLGMAIDASEPSDESSLRILEMTIDEVLQELPPNQQRMISLRIEGYSVQSIAEKTDRSKRSVERVLQRFRERMDALVHDESDDITNASDTE